MAHLTTESPDMAAFVARLFRRPPPLAPLSRRAERVIVALPTQYDIDEPVTPEARAALAIATRAMAATMERLTGRSGDLTLGQASVEAKRLLSAYLRTYRRIAARRDEATR